jgi:hypothetical protein
MEPKKVKCIQCFDVLDSQVSRNCRCTCGKVVIVEGSVFGVENKDYKSLDPILLNE